MMGAVNFNYYFFMFTLVTLRQNLIKENKGTSAFEP